MNLPDLFVQTATITSAASTDQPGHVTRGNGITVSYTVVHDGAGAVPADQGVWVHLIYLFARPVPRRQQAPISSARCSTRAVWR